MHSFFFSLSQSLSPSPLRPISPGPARVAKELKLFYYYYWWKDGVHAAQLRKKRIEIWDF